MDIQDAKNLGFKLIGQFLNRADYHLTFDQATARCGACRTLYGPDGQVKRNRKGILGEIILSTRFIQNNSLAEVEDTIRHEIAHALCNARHGRIKGFDGKYESHGLTWKKVAMEVGAKPRSCADVYIPKFYQLICSNPKCGGYKKKQSETNNPPKQGHYYPCKYCKSKLDMIPNSGGQIRAGVGLVEYF